MIEVIVEEVAEREGDAHCWFEPGAVRTMDRQRRSTPFVWPFIRKLLNI
jgi:hypothetical protein